jgi:hypothetical protein
MEILNFMAGILSITYKEQILDVNTSLVSFLIYFSLTFQYSD